jgi:hypothetical protein
MLPAEPTEPEAPTEPETPPAEAEEPEEPKEEGADAEPAEEGEKPEAEPSEEDAEAKKAAEAQTQAQQAQTEEKRKRAGGWQRKIDRLERQNQLLVERLTAQHPAPQPQGKPEAEKTPAEKSAEYLDSLVDQRVEQRLAARENQQREKTVVSDFQRRTAEVRARYDDFEDVVSDADIPVQSALGQTLLTSEHGPAIMYQLAKNPAELARLSALPPLDAAREVGRLEAKLASGAPSVKPNGSATKRPPAPPTSVNGSAASTRSLDDLPLSEYKRAMRSGRR